MLLRSEVLFLFFNLGIPIKLLKVCLELINQLKFVFEIISHSLQSLFNDTLYYCLMLLCLVYHSFLFDELNELPSQFLLILHVFILFCFGLILLSFLLLSFHVPNHETLLSSKLNVYSLGL